MLNRRTGDLRFEQYEIPCAEIANFLQHWTQKFQDRHVIDFRMLDRPDDTVLLVITYIEPTKVMGDDISMLPI